MSIMKKTEKTWILRGSVKRFKSDFLEGLGSVASVVMETSLVQSGNSKGFPIKQWIELNEFGNSQKYLSGTEFYLGEELIVWVEVITDENGKKTFTMKRLREKTMDIISGVDFLDKFV